MDLFSKTEWGGGGIYSTEAQTAIIPLMMAAVALQVKISEEFEDGDLSDTQQPFINKAYATLTAFIDALKAETVANIDFEMIDRDITRVELPNVRFDWTFNVSSSQLDPKLTSVDTIVYSVTSIDPESTPPDGAFIDNTGWTFDTPVFIAWLAANGYNDFLDGSVFPLIEMDFDAVLGNEIITIADELHFKMYGECPSSEFSGMQRRFRSGGSGSVSV